MLLEEFPDAGLLDRLQNQSIEKYKFGSELIMVAPTWLINDNLTLEDFLEDFANPKKATDALRDFACQPSSSIKPFFKDPSILFNNSDRTRVSPLEDGYRLSQSFKPLPGVRYYFASDLAVSRDSIGNALVHRQFSPSGEVYVLDFSFQMKTNTSEPVDYETIREIIYSLKRRGFDIRKVGFDQFQSHDSATILSKKGYETEIVKYHDSLAGCGLIWDLVHQRSLIYGLCDEVFIGEASELQVINKKRIDHLTSGGIFNSKDVWDAVVNAVVLASQGTVADSFEAEYL